MFTSYGKLKLLMAAIPVFASMFRQDVCVSELPASDD